MCALAVSGGSGDRRARRFPCRMIACYNLNVAVCLYDTPATPTLHSEYPR